MKNFNYEAYNQKGQRQTGAIEAMTKPAAVQQLSSYGLRVVKLRFAKNDRWALYLSRFVELAVFLMSGFLFVKVVLPLIIQN